MVHGLAAQSGGQFTLASELRRGTTAEILLPRAAAQTAPALEPARAWHRQNQSPDPKGLSVLVVDDDPLILMGTVAVLEDLGHAALQAGSGQEALAILRGGQAVDVVVTDQAMPGMTGLQLAAAIRAERPGLPVVLATGYADLSERAAGEVSEVLSKPFQQQDLAAALARAAETVRTSTVVPLRLKG
jgi:CheY-like chemotaxis protein